MPLYVQLLENGKPYSLPAGAIIEINFENPQGLRFPRDGTVRDYEQGQILYNIDSSDIAIAGKMYASVTVIDGTKRLTWQSFVLKVSRNLSDNQVAPPDVIGPWQSEIEEKLSNTMCGKWIMPRDIVNGDSAPDGTRTCKQCEKKTAD